MEGRPPWCVVLFRFLLPKDLAPIEDGFSTSERILYAFSQKPFSSEENSFVVAFFSRCGPAVINSVISIGELDSLGQHLLFSFPYWRHRHSDLSFLLCKLFPP